jgi:phage terminase large subunit
MSVKRKPVESAKPKPIQLRGDNGEMFNSTEHECIISGPADSGKTISCCVKVHMMCMSVANVQGAIVRKTNVSLTGTVLKTFQRIIAGAGVRAYGGETPSRFIYPNGSVVWAGGMDNPGSILSGERDFVYVCQTEELTLNDWEMLATRCTGRGAVIQYPQLFGDCNPAGSRHWIRERAAQGKLRLLNARHIDNPGLFDENGVITEDGKNRLAVLENLTGVRRKRLLEGIWATAEGAVFDTFDAAKHVMKRDPKEMKRWFLCIDEGYTNPCAIGLCGDDSDGRRHLFQEFYKSGQLESYVVSYIVELNKKHGCELASVDDAAAGLIASLKKAGVNAKGGKGRIIDGINAIQNRLRVCGDGRPRFTIDPDCVNTINEFESHVWRDDKPKDVPVDADNHMISGLRYLEDVLAVPTGAITDPDAIRIGRHGSGTFRMPLYKGMRL